MTSVLNIQQELIRYKDIPTNKTTDHVVSYVVSLVVQECKNTYQIVAHFFGSTLYKIEQLITLLTETCEKRMVMENFILLFIFIV